MSTERAEFEEATAEIPWGDTDSEWHEFKRAYYLLENLRDADAGRWPESERFVDAARATLDLISEIGAAFALDGGPSNQFQSFAICSQAASRISRLLNEAIVEEATP
jgi:hypothetical protein